MTVRVNDKMPSFRKTAVVVLNDALREGARDILIKSRQRAPFKQGPLRSNSEAHQMIPLHYRVSYWLEYARYQEKGGTANRRVRKYSTAGTGKNYLKGSGDEVAKRISITFKKHGLRAKAF